MYQPTGTCPRIEVDDGVENDSEDVLDEATET